MIPVDEKPEPDNFDERVRQPGLIFLKYTPNPTSKEWEKKAHWRKAIPDLFKAYNGICAYSCHWVCYRVGNYTVDHFIALKNDPRQAYEWNNLRYACGLMNTNKGVFQDVIDPFKVTQNSFIIDFSTMMIKPNIDLDLPVQKAVQDSIDRLKLNSDDMWVQKRSDILADYCNNEISFVHLTKQAPFIAYELERQNKVRSILVERKFPAKQTAA